MSALLTLLGAALAATGCTAVLIRALRHFGVVDIPVGRSLHTEPVVRGGGLAILVALGAGMLLGLVVGTGYNALGVVWFLVAVILYGALGFNDDLASLSARFRFAIQIIMGLVVGLVGALLGGWHPVWGLVTAAALLVMVNITNFMDGADGLVATHTVVAGVWLAVLGVFAQTPTTTVFAAALAGAALGFLPYNAVRARIFLGDAGSYAIGAGLISVAAVLFANEVPWPALLAPFLVYLLDTGYTLQLRVRAGERWYEPHKLHVYQRLVTAGWPHWRVNATVSGATLLLCLLTVPILLAWPMPVQILAGGLMVVIALVYLRLPVWAGAPVPWRRR